ncbi:MAG: putative zinc-binding protein [Spirochaetes bacterium]|jgi:uncharacterized metal-binding protein|nr:putative zinc-binding protein [Spirochaetota bacterium]
MMYACSGAADVGEIADRVARKLRDEDFAKMSCLAAIGADFSGYVQTAKAADAVISIDGCTTACARNNFKRIGITPLSFVLTEMGLEKGSSPATGENVARIVELIRGGKQSTAPGNATGGCGCCG